MVYIKELGIYVNKVEDLRDKVSEDMYVAIENLVYSSSSNMQKDYDALESEFKSYEWSLEEDGNAFSEILDLVDDFDHKLDEILNYLYSTKRINREKLSQDIRNIKLDLIRKSIANVY